MRHSDSAACDVSRCTTFQVRVVEHVWTYARAKAHEIDDLWRRESEANPTLFDGIVHLSARIRRSGGHLEADLFPTRFRNFLYWRSQGYEDRSVRDVFGSAVIRSSNGGVLLGRQQPGYINAGLYYTPGGFIDARDVRADGSVDLDGSVMREVREETGLDEHVTVTGSVIVTHHRQQTSIGVEFASPLTSATLAAEARRRILRVAEPELDDVVVIDEEPALTGLPMPPFCKGLVRFLLAESAVKRGARS